MYFFLKLAKTLRRDADFPQVQKVPDLSGKRECQKSSSLAGETVIAGLTRNLL
jgi:hypothetical protein